MAAPHGKLYARAFLNEVGEVVCKTLTITSRDNLDDFDVDDLLSKLG